MRIRIHSQEDVDAAGQIQSHQSAEVPAPISIVYLSGGLKKIRRMIERYCSYRFSPACDGVHARWHQGEPRLEKRRLWRRGETLLHLGRLRVAATNDVYRGYMEILAGAILPPAATLATRPWPADMPWAAPSSGEFDVRREHERPPYLGTFEIRVQRTAAGCTLHTIVQDLPVARDGRGAHRDDFPLRSRANVAFLEQEIAAVARESGVKTTFEITERGGVPARLDAIYAKPHSSPV